VTIPEAIYAHFYRQRKRQAQSRRVSFENVRVFSVGNLTTGGTGKTPAVQWLVRRLENAGMKTAIVARGYGGEYSRCGAFVSDGARILLDARQAGDEAILHARALPQTPVVIGRDRVAATKTALEKFALQAIVLDDGFQFWSLARDFDLVLLDARAPFGNGKLLPLGRLREPQKELARASGVLLTRAESASPEELQNAKNEIRKFSGAPVFVSRHTPVGLRDEGSGEILELEKLRGQRVAALAALANNQSFFDSLRAHGAVAGSTLGRRDHHRWRENEVRAFVERAQKDGAQAILTTEKDAVKMDARWCAPLPLWSLRIELQIENEDGLWRLIQKYLS
jgi:tetraacyldisaccharide 4'-kinase